MNKTKSGILLAIILSLLCCTCAKSRQKKETDSGTAAYDADHNRESGEKEIDIDYGPAECRRESRTQSSCLSSEEIINEFVIRMDTVDLLLVVDNSKSMEQEQAKLRAQIPKMIKVLTTGDRTPDDAVKDYNFPPVMDLHLAVISSDMGLPGLSPEDNPDSTGDCQGTGDDGNFLHDSRESIAEGMSCPGADTGGYPLFLEHNREENEDTATTLNRAATTAFDFGCVSYLGTSGCGFEMQLEAPLKALWPSQIGNLSETQQKLEISFLGGSQGHGDVEHRTFLRGTPYHPTERDRRSLLAIIVVTDEEDCSAGALGNLEFLTLDFPGGTRRDLNLRCYKDTINNWGNKYPVNRYIDGFKALRPTFPYLVVFAAIAGIPQELIEDANGDNAISKQEREDYYNQILGHPSMQETVNEETTNLNFSCQHQDPATGDFDTKAYPARRITEVARGFGQNGVVRSICADDFTPAMDAIINIISKNMGDVCLPHTYTRDSRGMINCDLIWTMPSEWNCDEFEYLNDPAQGRPQFSESGRKRCVVDQLPVISRNKTDPAEALDFSYKTGLGWYYDDFSSDMQNNCKIGERTSTKQRISFALDPATPGRNQDPPAGVNIYLECFTQIAIWPDPYYAQNNASGSRNTPIPRADYKEEMESMGAPCENESGRLCPGPPVGPKELFCYEQSQACVLKCRFDDDCPADWVCDDSLRGESDSKVPFCINPVCELPEGEARNCGNSDVGEACMPLVISSDALSRNDVFIETNAPACNSRICGMFGFEGDPREQSSSRVREKIYCTCRCRSSNANISTCTCPDGFECSEDLLNSAGSALAGGYCIRKDS